MPAEDLQQTAPTKTDKWFAGYVVAGLIWTFAQNFRKTAIDELMVLVVAIGAGVSYHRIKSKIKIKNEAARIIVTFIVIEIIAGALIGLSTGINSTQVNKLTSNITSTIISGNKFSGCTRTERLKNDPEIDRALSLINERVAAMQRTGSGLFPFFPANLVNCIHVELSDVHNASGVEGYFIFNDKNIKPNYFPITIDQSYFDTDDVINALLLTHEMTHVQQYIDEQNGKAALACIDKETDAFTSQMRLMGWLRDEERKSIDLKIANDNNLNPQLQIIKTFSDIHVIICPIYGNSHCIQESYKDKIKEILMESDFYKRECKIA